MIRFQRLVAWVLVCSIGISTGGCSSMKTIRPVTQPGGTSPFGKLKAGDTVDLRTKDGRTIRFIVQQVEADTILAPDGVRYTRAEIVELKRRSFSGPKTAGLVAGIFAGVFILVAAAAAAALDGLLG